MTDVRARNNVAVAGQPDGPVVMFAHGFGCDQNMWRHVSTALADRFRIVLFDHVGSGRSDPSAWDPKRYSTLDGYTDDVLQICRDLDLHDAAILALTVERDSGQ